jgi:Ankyrin repeats (many copies)
MAMVFGKSSMAECKSGLMALLMAIVSLWATMAIAGLNEDLFAAAVCGDLPKVERLIAAGADVNAKDKNGRTALMLASQRGHKEVAEFVAAQEPEKLPELKALPNKALIAGVPFISWNEAARLDYPDKDIINPSFPASFGMILKYWHQDLVLFKTFQHGKSGGLRSGKTQTINELKQFIAQGIPVLVAPAMTPVAHIISPVFMGLAAMNHLKVGGEGLYSGVLGKMLSFEAITQLEESLKLKVSRESLLFSARVVIGYDDDRKVLIMHDPSFGPAFEVSYADFEKMWTATTGRGITVYPPDFIKILASRPASPPYPGPTPNQQAAYQFVLGYAFSSIGQLDEGEMHLKQGLAIPNIGKGYQHLLTFELALHSLHKGNVKEAITLAQNAIAILPEHHRPWQFLAQIYKKLGWEEKAAESEKQAQALCFDRQALKHVGEALGQDFFIVGCTGTLLGGPFIRAEAAKTGVKKPSSKQEGKKALPEIIRGTKRQ